MPDRIDITALIEESDNKPDKIEIILPENARKLVCPVCDEPCRPRGKFSIRVLVVGIRGFERLIINGFCGNCQAQNTEVKVV